MNNDNFHGLMCGESGTLGCVCVCFSESFVLKISPGWYLLQNVQSNVTTSMVYGTNVTRPF